MEKDIATIDTHTACVAFIIKAYIRLLIFAAPDIFVFGPIWLLKHFGLPTPGLNRLIPTPARIILVVSIDAPQSLFFLQTHYHPA